MYALEVIGLPSTRDEGAPTENEVKSHFSQFGPVHSVIFIRDTGPLLGIYQRAEQKLIQAEIAEEELKLRKLDGERLTKVLLDKPKRLLEEFNELVNIGLSMNPFQWRLDQFPITSAIVIFERPKSKDVCLYAYKRDAPEYTFNCCKRTPVDYLFRGLFHLQMKDPPQPYHIYWENYTTSMVRRLFIGITLFFILVLYFSISLAFSMGLK